MPASKKDTRRIPTKYFTAIVVILYSIGVVGLRLNDTRETFIWLFPWLILFIFGGLLYFQKYWNLRAVRFLSLATVLFFGIEILSFKTGKVFGPIIYGDTLGFKIFGVPLVLPFFWLTLIYCTGVMVKSLELNHFLSAGIGAVVVTLTDVIIEPFAMHFRMWNWDHNHAPLQNYFACLLISFLILLYFHSAKTKIRNSMAIPVLLSQIGFFLAFEIIG